MGMHDIKILNLYSVSQHAFDLNLKTGIMYEKMK